MNQEENIVTKIQEEIKQQREIGGIWDGYCNLQKLASGDIWESSERYIYELLQNAEDAKATEFKVNISQKRVKIIHDGKPFTEDDVRNICYAVSKKDPNETIGYLGVGFRSVFAVTDKPKVYSGKYMFRFDREECIREFGDDSLFYFYPYWIEQPTEDINPKKTTFILPFKSEEFFSKSIEQLKNLGVHSLLFLRNIKRISIHNEEDGTTQICYITPIGDLKLPNNENIKIGRFSLVEGDTATQFLVFRGTFEVPDDIREDEETKRAKRGKIKDREISIAIKLDKQDNLIPTKGYISSFFPIEERKINFLVHADFIVQAGRVALLDNKWNRWIMEKAREVAETCYHYFQESPEEPKWIEQSLRIFEERKEISERYDDIFEKPLFKVTKNPRVICIEKDNVTLDKTIKITDETDELVERGFIKCSDLEVIFNEERHLIRKDYHTGGRSVKELKVDDLNSKEFIEKKIEELGVGKAIEFLILFYSSYKKAMEGRYARYRQEQRDDFIKSGLERLLVIDRDGNVRSQDEVWIEPDLKIFDELKGKGIRVDEKQILSEYNLINKELWNQAKDYLPKVNRITKEMIAEKRILPKIKTSSEEPSRENLLSWTYLLKRYGYRPKEEIWVIDNKNQIRKSSEVFLSDKYNPPYHWQKLELPHMIFLGEEYLKLDDNSDGWKEFFENTSMKGYLHDDYVDYLKNTILPILKSEEEIKNLSTSEIIKYTQAIFETGLNPEEPIFIVTKEGKIEKSDSDVYFSSRYSPTQNWENQSIISLKFVSPDYISEGEDANKWREFFETAGVKEKAPDEMIEEFGKTLIRKKFEKDGYKVEPYGGRGGDLKAIKDDEVLYIEVKSRSSKDISDEYLDSEKAEFAKEQEERYYLAEVINIPNAPYIYLLKNPADCEGTTFGMNISKGVIERYGEKIDAKDLLGG